MYELVGQWSIRPEHVSAISHPQPVPNRPALYQMDVHLIGGQTISLAGNQEAMATTKAALTQAVVATT